MGAIGLNPIRIDRIGFDPIRVNAIRLGVPGAASGSGRPYIEPEVLASLKAVCICYGKSNDDPDRAIVKNLVDTDNPFVISNAAYKLNSGFGKYNITLHSFPYIENIISLSDDKAVFNNGGQLLLPYPSMDANIPPFKIKISGLSGTYHFRYYYRSSDGIQHSVDMAQDGYYDLPTCYNIQDSSDGTNCGFANNGDDVVTITQIPQFEGAFVTDGVDDLITSTKTVQEMLEGSNEITVVSMIHQIHGNVSYTNGYTNYIRHSGGFIRNSVTGIDGKGLNKTGIYGYTATNLNSSSENLGNVINNILGDKEDYTFERNSTYTLDDAKYSVQNFINANNQPSNEGSSVAWYWTVIANKVLTTDQINQVIAYFNLDRCVEPTVWYDVQKQGLTNETPAADWYLKDFSKNGFNMSLFNFAKKGNSGIGKYETDLSDTRIWTQSKDVTSSPFNSSYNGLSGWIIFANTELTNSDDMPSFKIQVKGLLEGQELIYRYYDSAGQSNVYSMTKDGEYTLPADIRTAKPLVSNTSGFQVVKNDTNSVTITQIPSYAGALCFDGVDDYGKVTGLPIYKDYTVIADYIRMNKDVENGGIACVVSKSNVSNNGAFISNHWNSIGTINHCYSFGQDNTVAVDDSERKIYYQSKYSNQGVSITSENGVDGEYMWLGTIRDNDSRFFTGAIYSLMTFPYSLSEFLIERQLKKRKAGTLYPDMIELRPIIKGGSIFKYLRVSDNKTLYPGDYINVGDTIRFYVSDISGTPNEVSKFTVNGIEGTPKGNNGDLFDVVVTKSPQKIDITIYQPPQYLTMLGNDTLISNETLIKNE